MSAFVAETRKVSAFMRRDPLSVCRTAPRSWATSLRSAIQAAIFGFVAQFVDPSSLPSYGGEQASYFEFVMIGVIIATVSGLLLSRVATAIRQEQMIGTLESLLVTPTPRRRCRPDRLRSICS